MNHSKNNNRNDNNRLVDRNHNCQSIRSQRVGGLILQQDCPPAWDSQSH
mgnify:CR=1 FL=1